MDEIVDLELDVAKYLKCYPNFDNKNFLEFMVMFNKIQKMKEMDNKSGQGGESNMLDGLLGAG